MPRTLTIAALSIGLAQLTGAPAQAQALPGLPPPDYFSPNSYILDPQLEKDAEKIKSQTYRTKPIGQRQEWNLDIGYFDREYSEEAVDPRERLEEQDDGFAGIRLSVPLTGGR
ncbi:MAG: hypothetical protein OEM91_10685 [Hyphomicrobiales bacterium]|nr:hypothetical protein [Hyphomicrobiales bacterium]